MTPSLLSPPPPQGDSENQIRSTRAIVGRGGLLSCNPRGRKGGGALSSLILLDLFSSTDEFSTLVPREGIQGLPSSLFFRFCPDEGTKSHRANPAWLEHHTKTLSIDIWTEFNSYQQNEPLVRCYPDMSTIRAGLKSLALADQSRHLLTLSLFTISTCNTCCSGQCASTCSCGSCKVRLPFFCLFSHSFLVFSLQWPEATNGSHSIEPNVELASYECRFWVFRGISRAQATLIFTSRVVMTILRTLRICQA